MGNNVDATCYNKPGDEPRTEMVSSLTDAKACIHHHLKYAKLCCKFVFKSET